MESLISGLELPGQGNKGATAKVAVAGVSENGGKGPEKGQLSCLLECTGTYTNHPPPPLHRDARFSETWPQWKEKDHSGQPDVL